MASTIGNDFHGSDRVFCGEGGIVEAGGEEDRSCNFCCGDIEGVDVDEGSVGFVEASVVCEDLWEVCDGDGWGRIGEEFFVDGGFH